MSAETLTITLKPSGFFDQNPSLGELVLLFLMTPEERGQKD
jgi:hypothetical protein